MRSIEERGTQGVVAAVAAAVLAGGGGAQSYRSYSYTELDGLPSAQVLGLAQARDGSILVATQGGLASFDGQFWERAPTATTAAAARPVHLAVDSDDRVWVAGARIEHGLARLEHGAWTSVAPPDRMSGEASVRALLVLAKEGAEHVVLATEHAGVAAHDGTRWNDVRAPAATLHALDAVEGRLFAATSEGAFELRPSGPVPLLDPAELPEREVLGVAVERLESGSARVWLCGHGWVACIDGEAVRVAHMRERGPERFAGNPRILAPDGFGGAYVGHPETLFHVDEGSARLEHLGMAQGLVAEGAAALLVDRDRNAWIGNLRGLTRLPPPVFANWDASRGLLDDEVASITELPDGTLVFGQLRGLTLWDGTGLRRIRLHEQRTGWPSTARANDLCVGSDGSIWVAASDAGLARVSPRGETSWYAAADAIAVASCLLDANGDVVAGGAGGVYRVGYGRLERAEPVLDREVRRLFLAPDGRLRAATQDGLYVERDAAWERFAHPTLDPANNVFAVSFVDGDRTLLGTAAGLFEVDEGALRPPDDVPRVDVPVYSLVVDRARRLWIGTDRGLLRWDGANLRRYTARDGLSGQETNRAAALVDSRGRLRFGTNRGVSLFREEYDHEPTRPTAAVLEARVDGERWTPRALAGRSLLASDAVFRFRAVSFVGDGRVRYRHRLEGLEDDWTVVEERSGVARHRDLPPGTYRFHVQASHVGGAWGPIASTPRFELRVPFWRTTWMKALAALFGAAFLAVVGALFAKRRQAARLEELVRARSAQLAESERRYREMFERNPAAQLLLDPDSGLVVDVNPAACRRWARPAAELLGRTLGEVAGLSDADAQRVLAGGGEETRVQLAATGPDDVADEDRLELHAATYELGDGRVVQVTLLDVTERERLEAELRQAQKLKAIGELAGGVAHDFNNLLTTIAGFSDLARERAERGRPIHDELARIRESSERGAALVDQLLAFGRRQKLRSESVVDVDALVRDFAALIESLLGADARVVTELGEHAGRVRADRGQLERVLMNLALNARDAMPDGGTLTLATGWSTHGAVAERSPLGRAALVTVRDTGAGMDTATCARVFEPFFTTKDAGRGAGLGLSTAYGIVHQSGGRIEVTSEPGRGSTFRIELPQVAPDAEHERGAAAPADAPAEPRADRTTVLVVEDDDAVRSLCIDILTKRGHVVLDARDADGALRLFELNRDAIDVVLTDVVMPGTSGQDLALRIGRLRPELPVLFMSGYPGERLDEVSAASERVLYKPFSSTQLASRVDAALRRAAASSGC